MRRLVPLALAALLTIGFAAPAAAGGKPERTPNEPVELVFENVCDFSVSLQDTSAAGSFFAFPPDTDGAQKLMSNGGFRSTLWNTEHPEISIDVKYFGRAEFLFHGDGTVTLRASGQGLWWFDDAADAAMYGLEPGVYLITGRVVSLTDENIIALEPATMHARVRDLCAELAPPV